MELNSLIKNFGIIVGFTVVLTISCGTGATANRNSTNTVPDSITLPDSPVPTLSQTSRGESESLIWSGESNGRQLRWTSRDFYVASEKWANGLFSSYANEIVSNHLREFGQSPGCNSVFEFTVLSLVDSTLSAEVNSHTKCGSMSDGFETYLIAFDLKSLGTEKSPVGAKKHKNSNLTRYANLRNLFSESAIINSLLAVPELQRTLKNGKQPNLHKGLEALKSEINESEADGIDSTGHILSARSFQNFFFERIDDTYVIVKLELTTAGSATTHPRLSLHLPIPDGLKHSLEAAALQTMGFLQKDSGKIANGTSTLITVPLDR